MTGMRPRPQERTARGPVRALALLAIAAALCVPAQAQDAARDEPAGTQAQRMEEAERLAEQALLAPGDQVEAPAPPPEQPLPSLNVLYLAMDGGPLMIPIVLMSMLVVLFAFERWLGLRRRKIIPPDLVDALGQLAARQGGLDPRQAYRVCQQFPSTASSVFRAVLLKVGRPHSEVEHTVSDASAREAARLYKNVRPIELAITVTPLLGLLGTVQGMIMAFYQTANMGASVNKAEQLADGIYVALVTTFAGLSVAIPAAILAHLFEGRIQSLFRDIDELLLGLLPQLERYEGKLRVHRQSIAPAEPPPASEPTPPEAGVQPQPAVNR